MTAEEKVLVSDTTDGIRIITLNNPDALNAIDMAMAEQITKLLDSAASDPSLRCLIITGVGERAFSAGFDIREMNSFDAQKMREAFTLRDPMFLQIARHPLPVIAALNGLAFGAGALIAAASDFRVACPNTSFKVTAINYGSANATWSLPRIVGAARAKDILMTGREVQPEEGLRIGLFDRLSDNSDVLGVAIEMGEAITAKPTAAVRMVKSLVNGSLLGSEHYGWSAEHEHVLEGLESAGNAGHQVFSKFNNR